MAEEKKEEKKVKRPSPLKRDMQNEKKRVCNKAFRAKTLTAIRCFEASVSKGDANQVKQALNNVYSLMDKGVKTGIYKQNKASRVKARLTQRSKAKA